MELLITPQTRVRSQRAAAQVYEQLRDMILALKLEPGALLSRTRLQAQYGVSSTPVRDALMRLEAVGLVEVFPQSGTIVSLIDVPLARQAQFLRRAMEQEVVRVLAHKPDGGLIAKLKAVIDEQKGHAKKHDLERFNDADTAFHRMLFEAAGVPDLWALIRNRSGHIDRIRRLHLPIGDKARQIIGDHSAIVSAIADAHPDRAQSEMRDHLSRSLAFSDELRARFPDYFKE
ncbi:MAG: GntR family transcriptional regulator [Xanthobacteraceae bacterium]|nr:GntR family transcriptional regulator [Xanthobacteraceae bacterium]